MISAHTSPADLAARILQPLARSLEEARQHLDLEPIDEASTEGAIAARQDSLPAAPPAVAIPTPRQPPPSGPSASGQAIDGRAADGVPTSPSEALAAATAHSTRQVSGSPDPAPSTPPASSAPAGFAHATARAAGPAAAPAPSPAPESTADMNQPPNRPSAPAAAPSTVSAPLRAAPVPAAIRLVRADSPADPAQTHTPQGTNPDSAPAALALPETHQPDGAPPHPISAPPGSLAVPSAPRQWRLRPSPPAETAPAPAAPATEATPTATPPRHTGGASASLRPRDPALPRVMQAMAPVLDTAWRLTDAALSPERSESPPAAPEAPRVANHFHVNVALGDTTGTSGRDRNQLEETLTALLRDAARRQGLDV